jgi:hypothetical protein
MAEDFDFSKWPTPSEQPIEQPATPSEQPQEVKTEVIQATEAKVETPIAPTPTPQPAFNPREAFGDEFESVDKVKARLDEYKSLSEKVKELEGKQTVLANDYVRDLNGALLQGISKEAFDQVYHSNPEKLDAAEKLQLQLQWKHGYSAEDAKLVVDHKYKLGDEHDSDDPDVKVARLMLTADSKEADAFLSQYRQKQLTPPSKPDQTQIVQAWEPIIPSIIEKAKSIKIDNLTYEVPQEIAAQVKKEVTDLLANDFQGDSKNPEHQAYMQNLVEERIKVLTYESAMRYFLTEQDKKAIAEKANPSKVLGENPQGISTDKAQSEALETAKFLKGHY